ncbi:MAG: thioredoxin family protein [Bacteroidales bacterium]|nr:thioredoxin family protein [Bacteroidales bacterium]
MRRLFLAFGALLAASVLHARQADTSRFSALGAKLEEYFQALAGEPAEVQDAECDFLISSCRDSLVRQFVTLTIYDHYLRSKIMGDEAVAVHVADKWLLSGQVPMHSDMDLLNARVFAEFNRSSLIGMPAPGLLAHDPGGEPVSLPSEGRYTVLYFYDTSCASCKVETARLSAFLRTTSYPVDVYAFYAGSDETAWDRYRAVQLDVEGIVHVWDPMLESDFQRKYGVLQTPRMFLVDPSGVIVGRGLDTQALSILLGDAFDTEGYVYGTDGQMAMYAQVFSRYGDTLKVSDVVDVADYVAARTYGEGDVEQYRHMEGDLLYYLSAQRGEAVKEGTLAFIERFIEVPDIWTTQEDTVKVLSLAATMKDLLSRTPTGAPVPDLQVSGILRRKPGLFRKGSRAGTYALRRLGASYLVFYTPGCGTCEETLAAVDARVASDRRARVLLVDLDAAFASDPEEAHVLLDTFDLSALPFVMEIDKDGTVLHKYIDF